MRSVRQCFQVIDVRYLAVLAVLTAMLGSVPSVAASCRPSLISVVESRQLLRLLPDVTAAMTAGITVTILQYSQPGSDQVAHFSIWAKAGTVPTVLDNGLLGYFAVGRQTAQVTNVADDPIGGGPEFKHYQMVLVSRHCLTTASSAT